MYLDEPSEDYIESSLKTVMDIHSKVHYFVAGLTLGTRGRYITFLDWKRRD